jgi:glycosyl transferase family 90
MTIKEQLQHKFILAIEGNDVATSTKWIMSSNSLLFMRKPRVETWFMEGRLIPDYHYVMVADDYSDLESLVEYYIDHLEEAERIIKNCSQYVEQFNTPLVEDWLSLKVLEQYFEKSGQS